MTVPYMVFSPFFRKGCLNAAPPRIPLGKADTKNLVKAENSKQLNEIEILPKNKWYEKFSDQWDIGEIAANKKLSDFVEDGLMNYKEGEIFLLKRMSLDYHLIYILAKYHQTRSGIGLNKYQIQITLKRI